jgi:hypothetical protein
VRLSSIIASTGVPLDVSASHMPRMPPEIIVMPSAKALTERVFWRCAAR